jgi:hypothetical protein
MSKQSVSDLILSELIPFTKGSLMATDEDELSPADAAAAYRLVDAVEKMCKARKDKLKPRLHQFAEEAGTPTEKGGFVLLTENGFKVTREKRVAADPSAEGIKNMLKDAGLETSEAFTTIKVLQLDASKVKFLVESGKFNEDEVEALKNVTFAMKVVEPKEAKPLIAKAKA